MKASKESCEIAQDQINAMLAEAENTMSGDPLSRTRCYHNVATRFLDAAKRKLPSEVDCGPD